MAKKRVDNSELVTRMTQLERVVRLHIKKTEPLLEAADELRQGGRLAARIAGALLAIGSFLLVYKNLFYGSGNSFLSVFKSN